MLARRAREPEAAATTRPPIARCHRTPINTSLLDERRDGEPVTRVTLLVTDPTTETWDVGRVRDLRHALGHRAAELGLPAVSLTLVPESEAEVVEAFAQ